MQLAWTAIPDGKSKRQWQMFLGSLQANGTSPPSECPKSLSVCCLLGSWHLCMFTCSAAANLVSHQSHICESNRPCPLAGVSKTVHKLWHFLVASLSALQQLTSKYQIFHTARPSQMENFIFFVYECNEAFS